MVCGTALPAEEHPDPDSQPARLIYKLQPEASFDAADSKNGVQLATSTSVRVVHLSVLSLACGDNLRDVQALAAEQRPCQHATGAPSTAAGATAGAARSAHLSN